MYVCCACVCGVRFKHRMTTCARATDRTDQQPPQSRAAHKHFHFIHRFERAAGSSGWCCFWKHMRVVVVVDACVSVRLKVVRQPTTDNDVSARQPPPNGYVWVSRLSLWVSLSVSVSAVFVISYAFGCLVGVFHFFFASTFDRLAFL